MKIYKLNKVVYKFTNKKAYSSCTITALDVIEETKTYIKMSNGKNLSKSKIGKIEYSTNLQGVCAEVLILDKSEIDVYISKINTSFKKELKFLHNKFVELYDLSKNLDLNVEEI